MINTENYYAATDYYNSAQAKNAGNTGSKKADAAAADKTGQAKLSKKAQALLEKLRKTYGDMDFMVADFSSGEEAKEILSRGTKEVSVLFSSKELEKMASSEKYEKEYLNRIQGALRMSDQINREFGFTKAGENSDITKIGISFNDDGTTSFFAELEKSSAKQKESIEKSREEKREQKKADAKKTEDTKHATVYADSIKELVKKMKEIDWDSIKTGNEPEYGRKFDFSI